MAAAGRGKLREYRAKRDFSKTSEPRGASRKALPGLRFVIQKHAARRLHFDLRLELDGVFKSWAVTRGPSLDPSEKRLAIEVEDHPLEYGDFEGTIPRGEYGGGTVQLWDRGYWAPEQGESPREALRKGELRFTLEGERLEGRFVLVRIRHPREGGRRKQWLLIKRRDESATSASASRGTRPRSGAGRPAKPAARGDDDRSVASGRTMEEITAGAGPAPKPFMALEGPRAAANAVWRSDSADSAPPARTRSASRARAPVRVPMPDFVPPQLCKLVARPPSGSDWIHEIKFDGYRVALSVARGAVHVRTRKGLDWTGKFATIAAEARALPDCVIDGEAVALDRQGVPSFAALQAALSARASDQIVLFAFDLLYAGGEDLRPLPLGERKRRLQALLEPHADATHIRYVEHFSSAPHALLESACRMQLEGIVSKRSDAPYTSGRGEAWTKTKCRGGQEVVIGGWSGRGRTFRSLLAGVWTEGRLKYVGRIGTGYGAQVARTLFERLEPLETRASPFDGAVRASRAVPGGEQVHWVKPELVAEIEFAGWTEAGQVRQASFKGLREDKPSREVRMERSADDAGRPSNGPAGEQDEPRTGRIGVSRKRKRAPKRAPPAQASGAQASGARASGGSRVMGVEISHPDKPLWPDARDGRPVTKIDLARYYEEIGPWMIEHLKGRPCSLVRAPDGIGGQHFFQRHLMSGASVLFDSVSVSGDRKPYLVIDRLEALAAAAQTAGVELHPWNCRPGTPEQAGRLVFDMDPAPDVPFDRVVAAALELRDRLSALGLACFCKTTGGKGLHVVTPLAAREPLDWPTAKTFAQTVCVQMAADSPERYLVNMSKKARTGRIFLDYLRNDRFATAVAPLSPRARDGAPVSMPIEWKNVRPDLDPRRFTLRTAPRLLAKSKPWAGYAEAERPLTRAIEQLTGAGQGRSRSARPKRTAAGANSRRSRAPARGRPPAATSPYRSGRDARRIAPPRP